jgi:ubiquinone/menaquinone biosynthesis C-methylase UbiE
MENAQTFSQNSDQYAKHRPQYPDELFAWLSDICIRHDSAWDCATGNGQAAVSVAKYFSHVEATDISAEQIQHHIVHSKVTYRICPAEHTSFDDQSFDLITVATAFHWFDQPKFFQEVDRVLKPKGVLAIWSYGLFTIEPAFDELIASELFKPIDRFWASGNRQMFRGYRDVSFPFDEILDVPKFSIQLQWNWKQVAAFLRTWSAVKLYTAELGNDPVSLFETKLHSVWKEPEKTKRLYLPIFLRATRKPA